MSGLKRIHLHWTAGARKCSRYDREHYHFLIGGDGEIISGTKKPEANVDTRDGDYVAHTRAANTGAIGVAVCGMLGAKERPFDPGPQPITAAQIEAMADLCIDLCETYEIPVTAKTVLTHAEVQTNLGIRQRGKWDINWLPGWSMPRDPKSAGDEIRLVILKRMRDEGSSYPKSHFQLRFDSFFRDNHGAS